MNVYEYEYHQIMRRFDRLENRMADIATDLANLSATVSAISADVARVLQLLANAPNITPDQVATLETQITALQQLQSTIEAALPPV